ncbi:hypothetical protein AN189_17690 [Loktanella sp. 3ANDIMAR09]|uniref:hypothetical protein n=1 Tax=Loktanella sp. 3ANDIMAR09 TaxID=1225657 RepID=UPI0007013744|nr:hypothetical protein [Loktanella sp. 3ANDIMAR09]KQI67055.1 hypothetical protein AN189_17690 [Loktanella sp. 3ANDIMAR09]
MIVTVFCPEQHIDDANNLAMCLAFGPADADTYRLEGWSFDGVQYAVTSFPAPAQMMQAVGYPLGRPSWDNSKLVNVAGANRARVMLDLSPEAMPPRPDAIVGRIGPMARQAINDAGLVWLDL